ncbi:putative F-box protein [Arabidopsis thaliana]
MNQSLLRRGYWFWFKYEPNLFWYYSIPTKHSDIILVYLLIEMFSRVPAKSIARFRCVSESIHRRPDVTEQSLTKSMSRPRLLFAWEVNKELLFFASPQPQKPYDNSSLVATPYKRFPKYLPTRICTTLGGLVFLQKWRRKKTRVICNPVSGDYITLPKVKATGVGESYFGFDPITKQFKVLCMTWSRYGTPNTHQVLTLETGKRLWRTIQDPILPHYRSFDRICINGVLYYGAYFEESQSSKIVCFDFRFEKFSFINIADEGMFRGSYKWTLFNYKGKLGAHQYSRNGELVLWVLEDAEKHKWSKSICILPPIVHNSRIVGVTGTGEIVFSPYACYMPSPFYIFFYNIQTKTCTRVHVKGFEEFKHNFTLLHTFLDFVEDTKFM